MVEKKISITLIADVDDDEVEALEDLIERIQSESVNLGVNVDDDGNIDFIILNIV